MDYRTKITVGSAVLGVLTLTAVLGLVFSQQAAVQRETQEPLLAGYVEANVTGLTLDNGVVLAKAASWGLTYQGKAFPVSSDRVTTYLKTLSTLRRERLVTREDSALEPFGLASGFKTLKILGTAGAVIADLQIGGPNELGDKVYVRFAGQKEVWQTDRGFARTLELDFNTWADLSLFPGRQPADLIRIAFDSRIETADKTVYAPFDLVKTTKDGKDAWEERISKSSTETMASWANLVASFRFGAYADPQETPAASSASLGTLTVSWSDGTLTTIRLGSADGQNRYRGTDGDREFWINDWALGQLLYK